MSKTLKKSAWSDQLDKWFHLSLPDSFGNVLSQNSSQCRRSNCGYNC